MVSKTCTQGRRREGAGGCKSALNADFLLPMLELVLKAFVEAWQHQFLIWHA